MRQRRRASTLVELVMCMTAGSTLMVVAIGLVHQALTISRQSLRQADQDRSLARLATQFRHDAHRATEVSSNSSDEMRLRWDDQNLVIYRFADKGVVRRQELASGQGENEVFPLADQHSATFQARTNPLQAELRIDRQTDLHNVDRRLELHVVASVNTLAFLPQTSEGGQP